MAVKLCRRCKKQKGIYSRGQCQSCYQYCRQKVASGETTWELLVKNGWAEESSGRGRPILSIESMNQKASEIEAQRVERITVLCTDCGFMGDISVSPAHRKEFPTHNLRLAKKEELATTEADDQALVERLLAIQKQVESEGLPPESASENVLNTGN